MCECNKQLFIKQMVSYTMVCTLMICEYVTVAFVGLGGEFEKKNMKYEKIK